MKRIFAMILTIAMLMTAMAAIAEGKGGPMGGPRQEQTQQGDKGPRGEAPRQMQRNRDQQPPEKPSDAPEKPSGEKPADAPEREDLTGEKPDDASEESEAQTGDKPELPSGGQGQQPPKTDDRMVDFDAMVTSGVISQETREQIKAYMDAHRPEDAPADGQAPTGEQQPTEKPADEQSTAEGQGPDLLADLLNAGVITQAEYEALTAAQAGK